MRYPGHADKKSFRIFLGISAVAYAALLIPLYVRDGALPRPGAAPSMVAASAIPQKLAPAEPAEPSAPSEPAEPVLEEPPPPTTAVFTVDRYDPSRDPAVDLEETLVRARDEEKHVLVLVGGAWCLWSRALEVYIRENEETAAALGRDYLVMKVNYSQANENRIFIESLEEIQAIPHFFVLDSEGNLLHSQATGPLEKGPAYNTEAVIAFLADWTPAKKTGELVKTAESGENDN